MTHMIAHSISPKSIFMDMNIVVGGAKKHTKHPLVFRDLVFVVEETGDESALFDMFVSLVDYNEVSGVYKIRCSTTLGIGEIIMSLMCDYGEISVLDLKGNVLEQYVSYLTDAMLLYKQQILHWLKS